MRIPKSFDVLGKDAKSALTNIILVVNPLVWYSAVIIFLQSTLERLDLSGVDGLLIWILHFSAIAASAIIGAAITNKVDTRKFLTAWMVFGAIAPLTLYAIDSSSVQIIGLIAFFLGASFGIGMPACMEHHTNQLPIEKRGQIGGLIILSAGVGTLLFGIVLGTPIIAGLVLALWRLFGLLAFRLSETPIHASSKTVPSYRHILGQRSFLLYLIPWVMFSLLNYITAPIEANIVTAEVYALLSPVQSIVMGMAAVAGGFLLDHVGRKRIAIVGFVMLGIGAAFLGMYSENLWGVYFNTVLQGIAWGFLLVIFIVTIWGDLSNSISSSKYYAIGVLPFFASKFLEITLSPYIADWVPPNGSSGLFSLNAFFLFIAVLPLVYAPETLPDKVMNDRDLKSYVDKAIKKVQKETEKNVKKDNSNLMPEKEQLEDQAEETDKEYEEAQRLSEKYY